MKASNIHAWNFVYQLSIMDSATRIVNNFNDPSSQATCEKNTQKHESATPCMHESTIIHLYLYFHVSIKNIKYVFNTWILFETEQNLTL